jgi:PleD family two-component response regulator
LRVVETVDEHEFCIDQVCVPLSVAVGVAVVRRGDTPESGLERADKEMYRIKGLAPRMLQT